MYFAFYWMHSYFSPTFFGKEEVEKEEIFLYVSLDWCCGSKNIEFGSGSRVLAQFGYPGLCYR